MIEDTKRIERPLVSVCTLTYNQQDFIKQTVESLLMQETNFEYEVVISDDGSTDDTIQIIYEIIRSHEKGYRVKLLAHENMGVLPNYIYTFKQCSGKYIAFCEGDDYWTDSEKLQIQADFLEINEEYAICFHKVNKLTDDLVLTEWPTDNFEKTYTVKDLAAGPLMYTPTVMLRSEHIYIPDWYVDAPLFDYPLQMMVARKGKIKYLPLNMANYRVGTGIWTSDNGNRQMKKLQKLISLLQIEFVNDHEIFKILSERNKQYTFEILEHQFYLDLYQQKIDFSKISFATTLKLVFNKLKSKFF
ncbi:glycosyltransferase family 2 protein [Chryseobacterium sp. JAH]|uniref:glycosyltransferase family 2 protein n=1 Tax=Chryseobacterium sp. JAH TaxID=1742858 RepID=UPI000740F227|nr:glycosyltransferase family 2 protein [Chryseobacterium sp. JAH]KUJ51521.1 hypothetical protein AR685_07660 [Chryseobacterium sp. JAH]